MKKLIFFLLAINLSLSAVDVDLDQIKAPKFQGSCDQITSFALNNRPTLLTNDYTVNPAVSINSDLSISWRIDAANSFSTKLTDVSDPSGSECLSNDQIDQQVKQRVDYYMNAIEQKTNPLIQGIETEAANSAKEETTAAKSVKSFMLQGSEGAANNTFFGKFYKRIQDPYNTILETLFLFFTLFAVIALLFDTILQKDQSYKTEWIRRTLIGISIVIVFYSNGSSTTTRAQDIFAWFVGMSTQTANAIAGYAHVSNAESVISSISNRDGFNAKEIESEVRKSVIEDQKGSVNEAILSSCMQTYKTELFDSYKLKKTSNIFPKSPAELGKSDWEFENEFVNKSAYNSGADEDSKESYFSVQTCSNAEVAYKKYKIDKKQSDAYFDRILDFSPEKIHAAAVKSMNTNISMGWISVALLPAQQALMNDTPSNLDKNTYQSAFDKIDMSSVDAIASSYSNFDFTRTMDSLAQRFSYFLVPGVSGIFDASKSLLSSTIDMIFTPVEATLTAVRDGSTAPNIVTFIIPGAANVVTGTTGAALKTISNVKSVMSNTGAFFIAAGAGKMIVESLVYLVIVAISGLTIAMWYFEVLIYTISVPFVALYAFGGHARENVLDFVVKGVGIALKPALIVISILAAIQVGSFFESITTMLITKQDLMLMSHAKAVFDSTELSRSNPLAGFSTWLSSTINHGLIEGVLFIVTAAAKIYLMATIILRGPGMILEFFGKHVDASSAVESISSKQSNYQRSI